MERQAILSGFSPNFRNFRSLNLILPEIEKDKKTLTSLLIVWKKTLIDCYLKQVNSTRSPNCNLATAPNKRGKFV